MVAQDVENSEVLTKGEPKPDSGPPPIFTGSELTINQTTKNTMRKLAAIYARVSTKDQKVEMQLEKMRAFCKQRGWDVVSEFSDVDHGDNNDRNNYKQLIDFAKKGKCNVVVVYKFDRFARSAREQITYLEEFSARNIDFVSFTENIDTTTAMGKAFFTINAAFDELFLSLTRARIKDGIRHAKKHGTRSGKPIGRQPLEYAKIKETLTLYREGEMKPVDIQRQTGISKFSYYRIINGYDALMRGEDEKKIREDHRISENMMGRITGIVANMERKAMT